MAHTAVATMQTVWDCRWSRPGHHLTGIAEHHQPETRWVCVREGRRRSLAIDECESCPHWELQDPVQATRAISPASHE